MERLRALARRLQLEADALALVRRDPRVPRAARWLIAGTLAYALSPIDLIPDVIPVLGLVDDLILVPLGLWLALRMVPPQAMAEARTQALRDRDGHRPPGEAALSRLGAGLVVAAWVGALAAVWWAVL